MSASSPPLVHAEAFREGLRDLGYVEGQNIMLEWRWEGGDPDRYGRLAKDLVGSSVDVIVAGTTQASFAAKQATQTISIVMAAVADPVG